MIERGYSSIVFDCTTILRWNRPATGIVRMQLEVAKYLLESDYTTTFIAFKPSKTGIFPVSKEEVSARITQLQTNAKEPKSPIKTVSKYFNHILDRLMKVNQIAEEVIGKITTKRRSLRSYQEILLDEFSALALPLISRGTRNLFNKESLLICMGLDWDHSNYPLLYRLKREMGFKCVGVFCDGIVLRNPEWAISDDFVEKFTHHFYYLSHLCDSLVAISEYSKADFFALVSEKSIDTQISVQVLRLGDNFANKDEDSSNEQESISQKEKESDDEGNKKSLPVLATPTIFLKNDPKTGELVSYDENEEASNTEAKPALLPRFKGRNHKSPYVLYVSTLEPRKNHALLLDVWEILQERLGDKIPDLVFVGMKGWKMESFFERYEKNEKLKKHVHWYPDVGDEELELLYQEALFSVFPSFMEGWGLGVVESLARHKPVIISDAPALLEASQNLMPALSAHDPLAWADQIERWCNHSDELKTYTNRIKTDFVPRKWQDFAKDLIDFALKKGEQA